MSQLEDLRRFVAGVDGRSFTAAAEARVRCRAGLTPDDRSWWIPTRGHSVLSVAHLEGGRILRPQVPAVVEPGGAD
ncbi:hypothetical protein, partial [Azotobacter salinestris]|uniref:hypothetical protein n=1 Tax=Azotobacter salinestris TaxID=69964 RepID=UPI0032DE57C3